MNVDFLFVDHLSVTQLTPLTANAREWLDANVAHEGWQVWGDGVVIEPRYAQDILQGLVADGLTVA